MPQAPARGDSPVSRRQSRSSPRRERAPGSRRAERPARGGQPDQDRERRHRSVRSAAGSRRRRPRRRARAARRSSARSRSAPRAPRPSPRARSRSCRRRACPATNTRSNVLAAKRPTAAAGRTTSASISSSKYHLLTSSCVQRRAAARVRGRRCRAAHPDAVGDGDAGERRSPCRATSPNISRPSRVCGSYSGEPANVGRRKSSMTYVDFRDLRSGPRRPRRPRARAIATFIGSSRSAIVCSGRGSRRRCPPPRRVAGLRGRSAWCRWPASSSRASGTGSP